MSNNVKAAHATTQGGEQGKPVERYFRGNYYIHDPEFSDGFEDGTDFYCLAVNETQAADQLLVEQPAAEGINSEGVNDEEYLQKFALDDMQVVQRWYRVGPHHGFVMVTRHDSATLLFQGNDAVEIDAEVERCKAIDPFLVSLFACYDGLFVSESRKVLNIEWKPSIDQKDQGFEFLYVNGAHVGNICRGKRFGKERWFATDSGADGFSSKAEARAFVEVPQRRKLVSEQPVVQQ